jgi:ribosomal protein S18 acetylase RimI-like enzyme
VSIAITLIAMHPLDNPVWSALTTKQSHFALGTGLARRFPARMSVHGSFAETSGAANTAAYDALAQLGPEPAGIFFHAAPQLPPHWMITRELGMFQMLHEGGLTLRELQPPAQLVPLSDADLPEMSEIYDRTRPGRSIASGIHQLGPFLGVRREGKLVAMGGTRLHLPGYREITTVGTHPEHAGKGYATALVAQLVRDIHAGGEIPFLHVRDDNARAIAIYKRLGFHRRRWFHYATVTRAVSTT